MDIEGTRLRPRKRWKDNVKKGMDHFQVRAKDTEVQKTGILWRKKRKATDPAEYRETRH